MRPSRQFRPPGLAPLEDRVVLSQIAAPHVHHAPHVKAPQKVDYSVPTPDNVVKGNGGQAGLRATHHPVRRRLDPA